MNTGENKLPIKENEKILYYLSIVNDPNAKELITNNIKNLFLTEFEESFSNLLLTKADEFVNNLTFRVRRLLEDLYSEESFAYIGNEILNQNLNEVLNEQEEFIRRELVRPNYKILLDNLLNYERKAIPVSKFFQDPRRSKSKNIEIIPFLKSFRKHCNNTKEAIHTCGEKIVEILNERNVVTHLLCVKCKKGYLISCVNLYCNACEVSYFSCYINQDSDNTQIDSFHLQPATWESYHCGAIINDKMKCIMCKETFYLNLETGKLECRNENCKFTAEQRNIQWTCVICKEEFKSRAKVYNPLEFKILKSAIKDSIIMKVKARPNSIPCCVKLSVNVDSAATVFYHKTECEGELFKGQFNGKTIVVCEKCRSFNFFDKFIWTCPLCHNRFREREGRHCRMPTTPNLKDYYNSRTKEVISTPNTTNYKDDRNSSFSEAVKPLIKRKNSPYSKIAQENLIQKRIDQFEEKRQNVNLVNKDVKSYLDNKDEIQTNKMKLKIKKGIPFILKSLNKNILPQNSENINCSLTETSACITERNIHSNIASREEKEIVSITNNNININLNININKQLLEDFNKTTSDSIIQSSSLLHFSVDDYTFLKMIGEGSNGKIYLVEEKTTKDTFAMKKIIAHNKKEIDDIKSEYELMNSFTSNKNFNNSNSHILKIFGISVKELDLTTFALYVLMELADSDWEKEIKSRSKSNNFYTEEEIINIIKTVVKTLAQLQKENISHRDIKPQNILNFYNGSLKTLHHTYKLADFGEAKEIKMSGQQQMNTLRGTELYMSPLLFVYLQNENKRKDHKINDYKNCRISHNSFKSDVYSLGYCVIYAATLTFKSLYEIREEKDMGKVSEIVSKYLKENYSAKFTSFVMKMIEMNEKIRPDFLELEGML